MITGSYKKTQSLGEEFVKRSHLVQGATLTAKVVALHGDLGGGKTTFTQGIAKGLGIKRRIISPTFVVVRTYKIKFKKFYHIDLYRIQSLKDIEGLGIEEILENPENIVVIEWAERLGDLLPKKRTDVYFEYLDKNKRRITYDFKY
ncbi:MAG: tRNA (adenosine(37)-N6)-threonylcarbamoyltransferase complex ATPase subunit type 1 TsaE [Candidatus Levyibacteriota bacterium]|nr:MAG: tRNA (adenosine(37)-N6)-threonylcarbamoyltransferase complex ATPase subunit type 1 TsaE [Candidatus Levybacteria bacterium]